MKSNLTIALLLVMTFTCRADYWIQRANFAGIARADAAGFSIGSKGYLGTGYTGTYASDWWEYDTATDAWTQKAGIPGGSGYVETGWFSIGNKGYLLSFPGGTDFWEYDPALNTWTLKAPFPGPVRQACVTFVANNKGYVTTGSSSTMAASLNDLWQYDPVTNTWTQKSDLPGAARHYACGFGIGNKGYVGTGVSVSSGLLSDFWEYNSTTDTWSALPAFPGGTRVEATAFSIGNKGYMGMGSGGGVYHFDFYQFDPATNAWIQKADFGGGPREEAVQFSIGSSGYVGTGYDGVAAGVTKNDFWEYRSEDNPSSLNEINSLSFQVAHHSSDQQLELNTQMILSGTTSVGIYDVSGKRVFSKKSVVFPLMIDTKALRKGTYLITVAENEKQIWTGKTLIQ